MIKRVFVSILALCLSFSAAAQDARNSSATPSTGTTSFGLPDCGQWAMKNRPGADIWFSGYLSGLNMMFNIATDKSSRAYNTLDSLSSMDQAFAWMDNWCKANPLSSLDEGAVSLFVELMKRSRDNATR